MNLKVVIKSGSYTSICPMYAELHVNLEILFWNWSCVSCVFCNLLNKVLVAQYAMFSSVCLKVLQHNLCNSNAKKHTVFEQEHVMQWST